MPKLLIDEPPLLVIPSLAAAIGLPEAIFLQQLHYWIEANGHLQDDGRRWIFNSYESWSQQFPWWNVGTIRRIVATLRDAGIIATTTKYNRMGIDHTLWYTIDYTALETLTNPPSAPAAPPAPPDPPAENDISSAENDRPSAQNEQTIRAKCTDDPRKTRAPITRELLSETSPETSTADVVVVDSDPPQKPISLPEKTRARPLTRATCLPTYDAANTHPTALDHALQHAEILDPATRASILAANADLTVETILAWDAYRTRTNATNGRRLGPGALVSLLRSAAKPPRSTTDPFAAARFLAANGYLLDPDDPDPSIPPSASPTPTPPDDPAAHTLWQTLLAELSLSLQRPVYDNWLRNTVGITLIDDTLTVSVPTAFAQEWLQQRMSDMIAQRLQRIAGHPIHPAFQLPGPAP